MRLEQTIITSSSDEKLEIAKKLGANHTINYKKNPEWDQEVLKVHLPSSVLCALPSPRDIDRLFFLKQLTKNVGADHIFDNVGISDIERCFNCIAPGGSINSIGILGGAQKVGPNVPMMALRKGSVLRYVSFLSLVFYSSYMTYHGILFPDNILQHYTDCHVGVSLHSGIDVGSKQLFDDMLRFIETNEIKPYIDRVLPFEETKDAVEYLGRGEHLGKIVIRVA